MSAHALLIGMSHFDDPKLAKLNSPKSDVEAFAGVLKDKARGGFDSVTVSLDQDLLNIRDQLTTLMDGRTADDMVLLYYSGHGIVAKGQRLYLATGQSSFDRPQARSLATSEIRDLMEQTRAGRLVVILDCCHSGVFAEGAKGTAATVTEDTFGAGDGAEGQYVLTASNALQYAYDGAGSLKDGGARPGLSRFTSWLVDGLAKGEASPFEEQITLDSLYQYLCKRARSEGSGMTPQRFVKRGSGDFVIARNPAAQPLALSAELLAKLDSPDWKSRKKAVEDLGKVAKQPGMGPLAKKAVLDRVSDERDVDVREAYAQLLQKWGAAPEPSLEPKRPDPPPPVRPAPQATPKPREPELSSLTLDDWQTTVLVKSGVSKAVLTSENGPYLLMELQRRANGLRNATYMRRLYIGSCIFVGLSAIGSLDTSPDTGIIMVLGMIGFGVTGLVNRKKLSPAPQLAGDLDGLRLQEAVPLIAARWGWGFGWEKREYEAARYHRACWWMVGIGLVTFLMIATQL